MNTTLNHRSFPLPDVPAFKQKMLNWLQPFGIFCYLDNQGYPTAPQQTECLVAAGVQNDVTGNDLALVDLFLQKNPWAFGHLSYAVNQSLYGLPSSKQDKIGFPPFYFFSPQIVLEIKGNRLAVHAAEPTAVFEQINRQSPLPESTGLTVTEPKPVLSRHDYIEKIKALQAHIRRGDCYEINFCQEFFSENAVMDPFGVFQRLMRVSPNPFSAFYRLHDKYLLCASPERFLAKQGKRIFSQPIKGTAKRNLAAAAEDEGLKTALLQSQKERSENVMIVDLVRNDLTRICKDASVRVDELFGVYSFPQVHQLISTVSGELKDDVLFSQIIEATFPMGSMTGAPKHRVLQLIDRYEPSARGLFSGAVGYVNPAGDFDFNVVIRSLLYNQSRQYVSYQVGSGITVYADAEKEWEECLLKAEALRKALEA